MPVRNVTNSYGSKLKLLKTQSMALKLIPAILMMLKILPLMVMVNEVAVTSGSGLRGYGERRQNRRLVGEPAVRQLEVASVAQCLALCGRQDPPCGALQYSSLPSSRLLCQLFEHGVCSDHSEAATRSLEEAPGVNYMDISLGNVTLKEADGPMWQDWSCSELGYCTVDCMAVSEGDFCASDAACATLTAEDNTVACVNSKCAKDLLWQVAPELALPTWQEWAVDTSGKHWKKLLNGTCLLDFKTKLDAERPGGLRLVLATSDAPDREEVIIDIGVNGNSETQVSSSTGQTVSFPTPGILTLSYSRYRLSWCSEGLTFGTYQRPLLVRSSVRVGDVTFVDIQPLGESLLALIKFHSGLADSWLYEEQGVSDFPEYRLAADQYMFVRKEFPSEVHSRIYCRAEIACVFRMRPQVEFIRDIRVEVNNENVSVCVLTPTGISDCQNKTHYFDSKDESFPFSVSREFVHYSLVFRPIQAIIDSYKLRRVRFQTVPFDGATILMGIGGPGVTTFRQAPDEGCLYCLWKTKPWIEGRSGYSNLAGLLPDP